MVGFHFHFNFNSGSALSAGSCSIGFGFAQETAEETETGIPEVGAASAAIGTEGTTTDFTDEHGWILASVPIGAIRG